MPPACPPFCWIPAGSWLLLGPSSDLQPSVWGSATGPWADWAASLPNQMWDSVYRSAAHPSFKTHRNTKTLFIWIVTQSRGNTSVIRVLDILLKNLRVLLLPLPACLPSNVNYDQCTISKHFSCGRKYKLAWQSRLEYWGFLFSLAWKCLPLCYVLYDLTGSFNTKRSD